MDVNVQCFRKNGYIVCVKVGYIAVDIPRHWKVREVEYVGFSNHERSVYYDIALNGNVCLHIYKNSIPFTDDFKPFFFDKYPL